MHRQTAEWKAKNFRALEGDFRSPLEIVAKKAGSKLGDILVKAMDDPKGTYKTLTDLLPDEPAPLPVEPPMTWRERWETINEVALNMWFCTVCAAICWFLQPFCSPVPLQNFGELIIIGVSCFHAVRLGKEFMYRTVLIYFFRVCLHISTMYLSIGLFGKQGLAYLFSVAITILHLSLAARGFILTEWLRNVLPVTAVSQEVLMNASENPNGATTPIRDSINRAAHKLLGVLGAEPIPWWKMKARGMLKFEHHLKSQVTNCHVNKEVYDRWVAPLRE